MTKDQIIFALTQYGEDKIQTIFVDNNKRIVVEEDNIDKITWDDTNNLLIYTETTFLYERHEYKNYTAIHVIPYDVIQSIIFRV